MSVLSEKTVLLRAHATSLDNVKKLNCWGANLSDISVLQRMPNVEVLSLSVNSISTLCDFANCQKLTELYIRKNDIKNIDEIRYLKNLPKLRVLWISDNECANTENYRATVLRNIPRLQKLDNIVVTPEEVEKAMQDGMPIMVTDSVPELPSYISSNSSCASTLNPEPVASVGPLGPKPESPNRNRYQASSTLEETNKLRAELGIKPLNLSNSKPQYSRTCDATISNTKTSNVMTAVLALIQEMNVDELETVQEKVKERLHEIQPTRVKASYEKEHSDRIKRKELELN